MTTETVTKHLGGGSELVGDYPAQSGWRRVSWGAVLAGVVVVLATQLFLGMIGLSVGAGAVSPLTQRNPLDGIGTGAAVWFAISTLLALFAGGWVAGKLAGTPRRLESSLHGLLTWGLSSLLTVYLVSSAAGSVVSGAGSVLGQTLSLLGKGVGNAASGLAQEGKELLGSGGVDFNEFKTQALALLPGQPAPQAVQGDVKEAGKEAALNPQSSSAELSGLMMRLFNRGDQPVAAVDKEAAANMIAARTGVSHEQAQSTVEQWEQMYSQAKVKATEAKAVAEQKAREAGDKASKALTKAAAWTSLLMLLGALAATFGGFEAVPRDRVTLPTAPRGRLTPQSAGI